MSLLPRINCWRTIDASYTNFYLKIKLAQSLASTLILTFLWLGMNSCDRLSIANDNSTPPQSRPKVIANTSLLPFFDEQNNSVAVGFPSDRKVDVTPPPPQLNAFDRSVLQICGPFGTRVKPESFKQLLTQYPDVLRQVKQAAGGQLRPGRAIDADFLEDLTDIWFRRNGFEHIFCGEIEESLHLGGLHYVGRYLQLQTQGIGGRLPNNARREEVIPGVVYTTGVIIKQGNRIFSNYRKGYPYVSDARELLLAVTNAFKLRGNTEDACLYSVRDEDTGKSFFAVFVRKRDAIVTFYPDATPKDKSCKN